MWTGVVVELIIEDIRLTIVLLHLVIRASEKGGMQWERGGDKSFAYCDKLMR